MPSRRFKDVIFLGGKGVDLASTQVRCIDIANALGCDYRVGCESVSEVPDQYSIFICVKPSFPVEELGILAKRGTVIWDIVDVLPPRENVQVYIASTKFARNVFQDYGKIVVIPHHHCNISSIPNPAESRQPAWIGSRHWHPRLRGFKYSFYDIRGMNRAAVEATFRKVGIGLNLRSTRPSTLSSKHQKLAHDFHIHINSGIKLINCLGFGIPSISSPEPAYYEIGPECTIFSNLKDCAKWVNELKRDNELYGRLRENCLSKSSLYHLDVIVARYAKLLATL